MYSKAQTFSGEITPTGHILQSDSQWNSSLAHVFVFGAFRSRLLRLQGNHKVCGLEDQCVNHTERQKCPLCECDFVPSGRGAERGQRPAQSAGEEARQLVQRRRRARGEDPDPTGRDADAAEEEGEVRRLFIIHNSNIHFKCKSSSHEALYTTNVTEVLIN